MRKAIICLAALLLALPCLGALAAGNTDGMTVISSPEGGFSTLVDFACSTEYTPGDGLYIKLTDNLMPYVLVSVDFSDTRVTDAAAYLNDSLVPELTEAYRPNGALMSIVHGDGEINGRPTPVLELQYHNSQNYKITLIALFDVYDDYTVYYRARYYRDEDKERLLSALETVAKYLQPDPDYYSASAPTVEVPKSGKPSKGSKASKPGQAQAKPTAQPQTASKGGGSAKALSFTVTPIEQGGMTMGRCTAPEGYKVQSKATCDVLSQSAGNPWLLRVVAQSPDGMTNLTYTSMRDYMANATGTTPDGQYNQGYFTPMLHYMTAEEYCDYWANQMLSDVKTIELVEEDTYPALQATLRQREDQMLQMHRELLKYIDGLSADRVAITLSSRRYHVVTSKGLEYYYCVATATRGTWFTASLPGPYVSINNSYVLWEVPCVHTMLCPAHLWEERGGAFPAFVENTSVSDQFMAANQKLSNELWNIITGRGTTYANSYSEDVMREETASGDDYDEERFSDYIFDQNDYTLSDGRHVKVSTAYDYVFEGDNGNVYYSNSLSDQPGGSTQLYPNR